MSGDVPIVPHLYFPSFLDDNIPNERMTGIAMGLELMDMGSSKGIPRCQENTGRICVR